MNKSLSQKLMFILETVLISLLVSMMYNDYTSDKNSTKINITTLHNDYFIVAGTIRQDKSGEWYALNDEGHQSINVRSVGKENNYITINFTENASKVISFIVTPDESLVVQVLVLIRQI